MDPSKRDPNRAGEAVSRRRVLLASTTGVVMAGCGPEIPVFDVVVGDGAGGPDGAGDAGVGRDASDVATGSDTGPACPGRDGGPVSAYNVGTFRLSGNDVIIARDEMGLYAYSAICTHGACSIPAPGGTTGRSVCPCHGSVFDSNGAVVSGPALRPLDHFPLEICNGHVIVHLSTSVPPSTRVPVP